MPETVHNKGIFNARNCSHQKAALMPETVHMKGSFNAKNCSHQSQL
jgi:hypothetical protein